MLLDIKYRSQRVFIFRKKLPMHGLLKELTLNDALLSSLGKLYPSLNHLELEKCNIQKNREESNIYHMNLSEFDDICQLTFDMDAIIKEENVERPICIQFIHEQSNTFDHYYCDLRDQNTLSSLYNQGELTIPKTCIQLKIQYSRIRSFIFKKNGEKVRVA
jgi:hypothetical protein